MPRRKKGTPLTGNRWVAIREREPLLAEVVLDALRWARNEIDGKEFEKRLISVVERIRGNKQ
jgi:hypothetical protein